MPRWRPLPPDLDAQVAEFTTHLRDLTDRAGLTLNTLADRTGYSRTSWERFLDGRVLAPKRAVIALAEATDEPVADLISAWETAERAWTRVESETPLPGRLVGGPTAGNSWGVAGYRGPSPKSGVAGGGAGAGSEESEAGAGDAGSPEPGAKGVGSSKSAGSAGSAGGSPWPDVDSARLAAGSLGAGAGGAGGFGSAKSGGSGGSSPWPDARRPSAGAAGGRPAVAGASVPADVTKPLERADGEGRTGAPDVPSGPGSTQGAAYGNVGGSLGGTPSTGTPSVRTPASATGVPAAPGAAASTPAATPGAHPGRHRRSRWLSFTAGALGAAVLAVAAFLLTDSGPGNTARAAGPASPSPLPTRAVPAGVKCADSGCEGKDAEEMGCTGQLVTTAKSVTIGTTLVEVRYSKTCGTAWARITQAGPGDEVELEAGRVLSKDTITTPGDTNAYTAMTAVKSPEEAKACITLASGERGCTR